MTGSHLPMERMIARIARAIAVSHGESNWRVHVGVARAAVQAMREPTDEMLDAALPNLPDWGCLPEDWRAMIDYVVAERSELGPVRK